MLMQLHMQARNCSGREHVGPPYLVHSSRRMAFAPGTRLEGELIYVDHLG